MESSANSRRTQFSSCDSCRQSRVACDASRVGYQPGETRWGGSCSRCFSRNRRCTFEVSENAWTFFPPFIGVLHSCVRQDCGHGSFKQVDREYEEEAFRFTSKVKVSRGPDHCRFFYFLATTGPDCQHERERTCIFYYNGRNAQFRQDKFSSVSLMFPLIPAISLTLHTVRPRPSPLPSNQIRNQPTPSARIPE